MTTKRKPMGEAYTTRELSARTWADFERLFSQGGGWDFCACMLTQRGCHLSEREFPNRAERRVRNRQTRHQVWDLAAVFAELVDASGIGDDA